MRFYSNRRVGTPKTGKSGRGMWPRKGAFAARTVLKNRFTDKANTLTYGNGSRFFDFPHLLGFRLTFVRPLPRLRSP